VLPLRELRDAPADGVLVGLRHDVDTRLDSALVLAELERRHGIRSTYFVLHTAGYYGVTRPGRAERDPSLLPSLRRLAELGHEVGWHNDLVTLQLVYGLDPVEYVAGELAWLRANGIEVVGTAAHGSVHCHRLGFHNNDFFLDWPQSREGEPQRAVRRARLADLGLAYEAYHLGENNYYSDARFDERGRRWHPELMELEQLRPGERSIVLVHPCHWDGSLAAKYRRLAGRVLGRALSGRG
jgi:hypothetical protein